MRTNKKVWKLVSVVLALAMVAGLMPSGLIMKNTTVKAVSAGDEMFSGYESTSPSSDGWANQSSTYTGWAWGSKQSSDGYSYGLAFQSYADSFPQSGSAYYTITSMPAGNYTLTCTVDYIGSDNTGANSTIYPYIGGSQVTDYSISPSISTKGWPQTSVSNGNFSYTFTLDEAKSNYRVGFYVTATKSGSYHLGSWSLTCNSLSTSYSVSSTSSVSGATVTTGASESDILSALDSTIDVVSTDGTNTYSETLSLTWDLSDVDTSTAGSYTATYSYTSDYVGTKTGTVTVTVVRISSDQMYKDVITGDGSLETVTKEIEWDTDGGRVPGDFESGSLGETAVGSNGFWASSTSYVVHNKSETYNHTDGGTYEARMTLASSGMGSSTYTLYYGCTTSSGATYGTLGNSITLSSSSSWTERSFTFTATNTQQYLGFATMAAAGNGPNSSGDYAYLYAVMTDLTIGTTYTVTYYTYGYVSASSGSTGGMGQQDSTAYLYIDDVTVTYTAEETVYDDDDITRVYYKSLGTYSVDTASVSIGASDDDVEDALPTYVSLDVVMADSAYADDDDYYATAFVPVTWGNISEVDTSAEGAYTIYGTAEYAGTTFRVWTTVYVNEYGTIISSYYDDDGYGEGCFEDYTQWQFGANVTGSYTNELADINSKTEWYSAYDGDYAWNVWGCYSGDEVYLVYPVNGATAGTYTYSLAYIAANISAEVIACFDYDDIAGTYTTLGSIGALASADTSATDCWETVSGSFTYSGDDITGTNPAIGLKITITYTSDTDSWGWLDSFNLSGPIYSGEKTAVETLTIPDDTEEAVMYSDFSTGWNAYQLEKVTDTSYPFAGYTTYIKNWYWDDEGWTDDDTEEVTEYTEYDYGYAYYRGAAYNLTEGTYTIEALVAGTDVTLYPMIYDIETGDYTILKDYPITVSGSWSSPTSIVQEIELTEAYDEVYVGFYADTSISACWVNITNFSWYWGGARNTIWDDQPENGDFEYQSLYPWIGENDNDTTDFNYGYTVNQSQSGADGYTLNVWNNVGPDEDTGETNTYTFTMYEYIRLNEDGTWYLDYESMGETYSEYFSMTANIYTYDEDEGEAADAPEYSVTMQTSEAYSTWTEFVESKFGGDTTNVTLLEDGAGIYSEGTTYDDDGNIETSGTIIMLEIVITLGQYDWVDLDNIKLVNDDYVSEGRTYIAVDCFENGGFEDTWVLSQYWSGTGDVDSDDGAYGYSVGSDWEDETNAIYTAWNNDEESSHTYSLQQTIEVTSDGDYEITVDSRGWIYDNSSAVLYVYDEDGNVLFSMSVAPSSTDDWTTIESGKISLSAQTVTVVVEITLEAAEYGGESTYEDEDGNEVTADWYKEGTIELDNFVFREYVQISISGDGSYYPVYYNGSYVNGGNYVKGVDISSVIALEAAGTTFTEDVFQMLKDNGVNSIRIRVWNNPYTSSSQIYGGGQNDGDMARLIAQRAADVGMSVMISFHLSDFWADPEEQFSPKAWADYSTDQKASAASTYVRSVLTKVLETGVDIEFVTVGNEVTYWSGVSGESDSTATAQILVAAAQGVATFNEMNDTDILVGYHVAPTFYKTSATSGIYETVTGMSTSYTNFWNYFDFLSTSCYPYWQSHGSTTNDMTAIESQLASFVKNYKKPVMITEYNWPYTLNGDQDGTLYMSADEQSDGTYINEDDGFYAVEWSVDRQGQADMIQELNSYFASNEDFINSSDSSLGWFIGAYYWEPAWIAASGATSSSSWSDRVNVWLTYGCGVATYYGAEYMNDNGGSWSNYYPDNTYNKAQGSKTDEFTLFTSAGAAATSLAALNYSEDIMPIAVTLAQITNSVNDAGYYTLRFVGQITLDDLSAYDSVDFKIAYCNSDGTSIISIATYSSQTLYSAIKVNGTLTYPGDDYDYFYTYVFTNVPSSGTYYFKTITTATGQASYQQSTKYYKLVDGELSVIDAWDYQGINNQYTTTSGIYELYPDYIQ